MSQTAAPTLPGWLTRRTISVADYHRMAETGILTRNDRVELIEGQIIEMAPIGSEHAGTVNRLSTMLFAKLGTRAVVSVQNPVRLSAIAEPQPDFAILRPRSDFYAAGHPSPDDIYLLIEVADSSLIYDRDVKAALYAQHRIPEFWLLDLRTRSVTVHRNPTGDSYTSLTTAAVGDPLTIQALPGITFETADLLGRSTIA